MHLPGWSHEIVDYVGNGLAGHQIATSFPLDTGVVAIFICRTGADMVFKSSAMTDTQVNGTTTLDVDAITAFTSTGFTVGADTKTNSNGNHHIAIVLRDATADNRYMKVGGYTGNAVDGTVINVGLQPTHVWTFRSDWVYRSTDFTGDSSVNLTNDATVTNQIQGFTSVGFELGTDSNVNGNTFHYDYLACDFSDSSFADYVFQSFKETGTASADDRVTFASPLGVDVVFYGYFALVKRYASTTYANWRAANIQTGDDSHGIDGTLNVTAGIDALVAPNEPSGGGDPTNDGYIDVGEDLAPVGVDFYGYVFTPGYYPASAELISCSPNKIIIGTTKPLNITGSGLPTDPTWRANIAFFFGGALVSGFYDYYLGGLQVATTDHELFDTATHMTARLIPLASRRHLGFADAVMLYQANANGAILEAVALNFVKFILRHEVEIIPPVIGPGVGPGAGPGFPTLPGGPGSGFPVEGLPTSFNRPRTLSSRHVEQVISFGFEKGDPPALADVVFDVRDLSFRPDSWQAKVDELLDELDKNPVRVVAIGSRDGGFRSVGVANAIAEALNAQANHRDKGLRLSSTRGGIRRIDPALKAALRKMGPYKH